MAGTYRLHFQLHQKDEVQHRYLRRYRSYFHHLLHADKRFEGQLFHDSRKQALDTGEYCYAHRLLLRVLHHIDAGAALVQGKRIQDSGSSGTFALALAFAGNDLVNFIGVPLAGYSSFIDYTTNGTAAGPDGFLMTSLLGPAKTPWYFLIGAGAIMVYALCTSKKAHNVIKTSVDLSRQDEGEESFGSTPIARTLVRFSMTIANGLSKVMPESGKRWIETRFQKDEAIIADGAAFDLVRASINLVLAGLLIALGTSLKLPLSTTYVTFMVAMGTSLADRAWGRDSAVFRITGVLSVIGGWFITAGAAFTICFFVTFVIHFGGTIAIIALIGLAVFMLIRSQVMYKKRKEKEKGNATIKQLMQSTDNMEILELLRKHTREELGKILEFTEDNFERTVTAFLHENLRGLRRAMGSVKFEKQLIKQMKRTGTLAMCRLDNNTVLEKGLYYYQGNDFASELVYSVGRLCEPCLEHIDNNFKPLDTIQKGEFADVTEDIVYLLQVCRHKLENNNYNNFEEDIHKANDLNGQLAHLKREELQRIQSQSGSIKVSMGVSDDDTGSTEYCDLLHQPDEGEPKVPGGRVRYIIAPSRKQRNQPKVKQSCTGHFPQERLSKLKC